MMAVMLGIAVRPWGKNIGIRDPGVEREHAAAEHRDALLLQVVGVARVERTVLVAHERDDVVLLDELLDLGDGLRLVVLVVLDDQLDRVSVDAAVRVHPLRPRLDRFLADRDFRTGSTGSGGRIGAHVADHDRVARRLGRGSSR